MEDDCIFLQSDNSMNQLLKYFFETIKSAIDQYWQKLQLKDRWYSLDTKLAKQEESFSDIEYRNKNKNDY